MKKKITLAFIGGCMVLTVIIYKDLIGYGIMQAKGQLDVVWNARPIPEVMQDHDFPDSLKTKIMLMQEIREFAIDSLGLKNTQNFTSVYDQQGKDILWNLSASEPFKLKAVEWSFPFLGKFSYKGFFDLNKAKVERDHLKSKGYDTRIRTVNAWSTLGWFNDPILSNQLERSEGSLAEMVIHELTHATIFIRDSLVYNENLASFIGEKGAIQFLKFKYGTENDYLKNYIDSEYDYIKYTNHMLAGTKQLDSLYQSFTSDLTDSSKLELKTEMIGQIIRSVDTISFRNPRRFRGLFSKQLPNNCYFQSFNRYFSKIDQLERELNEKFAGNLKEFILYQKEHQ